MELVANIVGIAVFLGIAVAFSKDRRGINWVSVGILLALNVALALIFMKSETGRNAVAMAASGFTAMVDIAFDGIRMVTASSLNIPEGGNVDFFVGALLPIIFVVPLFDILTYIGLLPLIVKYVGKAIALVARLPKFESFFSIEMMFLGNVEVLAVSALQIKRNEGRRNLTLAMMCMSCVSAAILASYMSLMPKDYILAAVPLNVVNVLIITQILNPVRLTPEQDTIATLSTEEREPFFSFLSTSIINAGKLALIIAATVMAFVSLVSLIDSTLGLFSEGLKVSTILGYLMFPLAWLLGTSPAEALQLGEFMGLKVVTNEFVAMLSVQGQIDGFSEHLRCLCTVFATSFCNFGTVGIVCGFFAGIKSKCQCNEVFTNVSYLILSGVLVSLMSAGLAGLFVW
ncbi:MAG: hypothetical protein K6A65_00685 [Succinivibrionaceae bacterium]|nr:hypothetical protein [Succinivibrionaceae bacterium]